MATGQIVSGLAEDLERDGRSILLMEKPGRQSGNYCHVLYANGEIKQIPACR